MTQPITPATIQKIRINREEPTVTPGQGRAGRDPGLGCKKSAYICVHLRLAFCPRFVKFGGCLGRDSRFNWFLAWLPPT